MSAPCATISHHDEMGKLPIRFWGDDGTITYCCTGFHVQSLVSDEDAEEVQEGIAMIPWSMWLSNGNVAIPGQIAWEKTGVKSFALLAAR